MIPTLLVIGATGDLTSRLLLPALAQLMANQALPTDFRLVGAAHSDWTEEQFRAHVHEAISEHDGHEVVDRLADTASYRPLDVTDADAVRTVVNEIAQSGPVGVYIALPTALVEATLDALGDVELRWAAGSRSRSRSVWRRERPPAQRAAATGGRREPASPVPTASTTPSR